MVRGYYWKRQNKARKLVSTKHVVTSVLSSVTTDRSEKCIKASYIVAKVNTKKETPFRIENLFKYFVLAVVKVFCLLLQRQQIIVFRKFL